MGGSWLPDSPIGSSLSNELSAPSVILPDSDSDVEIVENDHDIVRNTEYYYLLTNDDSSPDWVDHHSDQESDEDSIQLTNDSSQKEGVDSAESNDEIQDSVPRDIVVDCDQVKAAMARITLPPSATPPWAASIPDSEWCSFLQNRIRALQEPSSKESDSKNLSG